MNNQKQDKTLASIEKKISAIGRYVNGSDSTEGKRETYKKAHMSIMYNHP